MDQPKSIIAPVPQPIPGKHWSPGRVLALTLLAVVLLVGGTAAYVIITWSNAAVSAPGRIGGAMTQFAADAVRPKVTIREVVVGSLAELHAKSKLVVFDAKVDADITREEGSTSWGVYWGTNVARVGVKDAHVPYVVELADVGTGDFVYSEASHTLTLTVPKPKVDPGLVAIDPASIQTLDLRGGWARWDKRDTWDRALAELKPKVIAQADKPFVQHLAEEAAIEALTRLLTPAAQNLNPDGVTIRIRFANQ